MPTGEPTKSFLMEAGSECEELKITHSNPLQEAKFYNYEKKRPDEGNPIKFYLLNFGNSVQPGDPVALKITKSGDQRVRVFEDNRDVKSVGEPGRAWVEAIPPDTWISTNSGQLRWPCEYEIVDATSLGYYDPGKVLRARSQYAYYKPGLTDAQVEMEPIFESLYSSWLSQRRSDYYWSYDTYPPPPEEYEIEYAKARLRAESRTYFDRQWGDWDDIAIAHEFEESGSYWTGTDPAEYEDYHFSWAVQLEAVLVRPDGAEINGEGIDPITLLAYEFISEDGLDINDIDDWTEALRINFLGTPAPLTIECSEPCEEGCLPVYQNTSSRICVCRETPGKKFVNEVDEYDYKPYEHSNAGPRLNDFNP
jgi:hypothetical protein